MTRNCVNTWCDRPHQAKGYCSRCYGRMLRGLDPTQPPRSKVSKDASNEERLAHKGWIVTETGCWEWSGRRDRNNYGVLATRAVRVAFAHRVAYETWVGPIPPSMSILHSCDNPPCINPEHLRAGTQLENLTDMSARERGNTRKLTASEVRGIRERSANESISALAKEFGVHHSSIRRIVNRETWKHLA